MYSVLMSNFKLSFKYVEDKIKKEVNEDAKVVVIPWTFAVELKSKDIREFFDKSKEEKYVYPFLKMGLRKENIKILDCYNDTKEEMINAINESSIIIIPGGNPEMLYNKIISSSIKDTLINYKKIIIGASAGAEIQLKKYFITKKNNYYKKFAWYDGIGIIDDDFYFDVHSINKGRYLPSLKNKSKEINKDIYCLFESGAILYDRKNKTKEFFGEVVTFNN